MSSKDILEVALEIVESEGTDSLSMTDLAERLDLSRSTLYRRVGSRRQLMERLHARGADVPPPGDARERILKVTIDRIGRRGDVGATIADIADDAGVSEVTVFRLFGDKESLLAAFADSVLPREEAAAHLLDDQRPLRDVLVEFTTIVLRTLDTYPGLLAVRLRSTPTSPALEPLRRSGSRARQLLMDLFSRAIDQGRLRGDSPQQLVAYFMSMAAAMPVFYQRLNSSEPLDIDRESRRIVRIFFEEFGRRGETDR